MQMNITVVMAFSNFISLLFLRSRGIKFKLHNCVIITYCVQNMKHQDFAMMLRVLHMNKPLFVMSYFHALRCIMLLIAKEPYFTIIASILLTV